MREAAYRIKLPHRGKQSQEMDRDTHTAFMASPKVLDPAILEGKTLLVIRTSTESFCLRKFELDFYHIKPLEKPMDFNV